MKEQIATIIEKLNKDKTARHQEIQNKIDEAIEEQKAVEEKFKKITDILPSLESCFNEQGLSILKVFCDMKTGCSLHLKAIPNKFKFLVFKGYTVNGDGKNSKALSERASKLEKVILEEINLKVSVNKFSLEIDENQTQEDGVVLIGFAI